MNYLEMNDVHCSVIAVKFFDRDLLYGLFVLSCGLHLMPHHGVLIAVPPERTLPFVTLHQTGIVILVHICRAVIVFVFFIVGVVHATLTIHS